MSSYSAGKVPQRDLRPSCAHRADPTADPDHQAGAAHCSVIPDALFDRRPARLQFAAIAIARHLVKTDRAGPLDQRLTDRLIARDTGLSRRAVQRALNTRDGLAMIRRRPAHRRRDITLTGTLLRARRIQEGLP